MEANYIDDNKFLVATDRTAEFSSFRRLKLDCGPDGIKYASVMSSSYDGSNTIVTIDENILTSNLTDVLYSVIYTGEFGNLPNHYHTVSEGDGGFIDYTSSGTEGGGTSTTFLDLLDTPSSFDEGKFLISTSSGVEWTSVSSTSTFLDLIDTPTSYPEKKYLRTTSSGIDFIDGVIITAPNNSEWVIKVTNSGTLYTESV